MPDEFDDLDDELEEDDGELEMGAEALAEEPASSDKAAHDLEEKPEGLLGVEVTLEALAARKGSKWSELAAELLSIREEKQAAQEQADLAARAQATTNAEAFDAVSEDELRKMFAAQQAEARATGEAEFLQQMAASLRSQGYGSETVEARMAAYRADLAASSWLIGEADPLFQSAEYQAHVRGKAQQARAVAHVQQQLTDSRTLLDDLADAEAGIAEAMANVALRGA